ncbi:Echinoderm microtubule-associated protein-like 5 [Blyttiomyces sp. JEL0837]|nr:Echinoderm microtubule-associated protein-like 5 [Blyttiomyces sp. JEL0837]
MNFFHHKEKAQSGRQEHHEEIGGGKEEKKGGGKKEGFFQNMFHHSEQQEMGGENSSPKQESVGGGGGGGGSSWPTNPIKAAVTLSVEVVTGGGFGKRLSFRNEGLKILCMETSTKEAKKIRAYVAKLADLLQDLPNNYVAGQCFIRSFPDEHELLGPVADLKTGKTPIGLQVYPSTEYENTFHGSIGGAPSAKKPTPPQAEEDFSPKVTNMKGGLQKGQKRDGPMSRSVNDDDFGDDGVSAGSNESIPQRKSNSAGSKRPSQPSTPKPGLPPKQHENFEVVGTGYGKSNNEGGKKGAPPPSPAPSHAPSHGGYKTKQEFLQPYEDEDDERENNGFAVAARESMEDLYNEDQYDEDWEEGGGGTREIGGPAKGKKSEFRTAQRFAANRPWAGAIVAPSNAPPMKGDLPQEELVLEYRFFQGRHKEDITAICVHPSKRLVATGDVVSHNDGTYIYIWDPKAPEDTHRQVQIRVGDKKLARGVSDLEFSPDGKYLVATAMDDDHYVYFYDWQKAGKLIAKEKGHTDSIFGITFNPKNSGEFVTFGVKHLKFWTFDAGSGKLKGDRGLMGSRKVQSIICCTYLPNGNFVTGTHAGEIIFWARNQVINVVEHVHTGPVYSICFDGDLGLLTGGTDGYLILHDPRNMDTIDKIQVEAGIRSVDVSPEGNILVGLEDSILMEIEGFGNGRATSRKLLEIESIRLQGKLRAICYSHDARFIAVGNDHGDLFILRNDGLNQVHFQKYEKPKRVHGSIHAIEVLKFSPDGRYLAVGTHDDVVYVWGIGSGFKLVTTCIGHSSFITHLDWSEDGAYIQTNSGDFELLFWSIPSGKQVTSASAMKDVKWATFTCILGWPVQGIWEKGMEGNDINWVDRHPGQTCLASGDDFFFVKLHVYPASKEGLPFKRYYAHGSHVTKVCFTIDGTHLISTGGLDGCTFQWRIEGGAAGSGGGGGGGGGGRNSKKQQKQTYDDEDDY